jgi:hypothetical protein
MAVDDAVACFAEGERELEGLRGEEPGGAVARELGLRVCEAGYESA